MYRVQKNLVILSLVFTSVSLESRPQDPLPLPYSFPPSLLLPVRGHVIDIPRLNNIVKYSTSGSRERKIYAQRH
jgi:hypothetical protein